MTVGPLIEPYHVKLAGGKVLRYKTDALDALVGSLYPEARLDTGVQWARWVVWDEIRSNGLISAATTELNASGHYVGMVCGKPVTVLFFGDLFSETAILLDISR